jgi:hypothetical protein
VGNSDAHALEAIGIGYTTFAGHDGASLRTAIAAGATQQHGSFHPTGEQLGTFKAQLRKYSRDIAANVGGRLRRDGSRRDLGYPRDGGELRGDRAALLTARRGDARRSQDGAA